jgi:hypothetical protein
MSIHMAEVEAEAVEVGCGPESGQVFFIIQSRTPKEIFDGRTP